MGHPALPTRRGSPHVGPIFRPCDQPGPDGIVLDIFRLLPRVLASAQAMIEEVALPHNFMRLGNVFLPFRDNAIHGHPQRKCEEQVDVVRHEHRQIRVPVLPPMIELNGFKDSRPNIRTAQLVQATRRATDGDEERCANWHPRRRFMSRRFPLAQIHADAFYQKQVGRGILTAPRVIAAEAAA